MHQQGNGVWRVVLISAKDRVPLVAAAYAGDPVSMAIVSQLAGIIERKPSALCVLCPAEFSRASMPEVLTVLSPEVQRPNNVMLSGICRACVENNRTWDELAAVVIACFHEKMNLREISVHFPAGTA